MFVVYRIFSENGFVAEFFYRKRRIDELWAFLYV
jgi:hypothetical protein